MKSKFEEWFQQQHFYLNLRFIHGERLFIFDAQDGYVVQAVQIAWATWQEQQKWLDELKSKVIDLGKNLKDRELAVLVRQEKIDEAIQHLNDVRNLGKEQSAYFALRSLKGSEPKEQDPQACDHTMVEKSQFGDLHRSFECIFCGHKTTEAWVIKHE